MNWILKAIAYLFVAAIALSSLVLIASVVVGAMSVGNLWLLLPLACYGVAFWILGGLVDLL
jgi:hypothetical protein